MSKLLALALVTLAACTSPPAPKGTDTMNTQQAPQTARAGLKIKLATAYVDDQDKALRFYTEVLGFVKKDDFSNGGYRWLTVVSPADPDGMQLQLALDRDPAAKAFQQAMFQ